MEVSEFILNAGLIDVVILLLAIYLYFRFRHVPTNANVKNEVMKIKADQETSFLELWDYIESTLRPIRSRLETRIRRLRKSDEEDSEDLNTEIPKKKGGIIPRSELKKYGIHR